MNKSPCNEQFKTHLFRYRFDGKEWCFELSARSASEAKQRLSSLSFAQYDGELVATVPASIGLFARIAVVIRNAFFKL